MALSSQLQSKPLGAQFNNYSRKAKKKKKIQNAIIAMVIACAVLIISSLYPKTLQYNNDLGVPNQPAVATTSVITCDYTKGVGSCIDPTGVEGEWVYVGPDRALAAPSAVNGYAQNSKRMRNNVAPNSYSCTRGNHTAAIPISTRKHQGVTARVLPMSTSGNPQTSCRI